MLRRVRIDKCLPRRRLIDEDTCLPDPRDADDWRRMLDRHGPALVLFARQWSATRADAEDAVQDGFVRFWRTPTRARDEVAFLYACVRTAAMDLGRGQRRRELRERAAGRPEASAFVFD